MLTRPRPLMRSARGPASSLRRHTGSEPPALLAALPLRWGARTRAPSCRCEAADSSTSWVPVSFIGILRPVYDGAGRRHHRSPHGLEAGGAGPWKALVLPRARTVTLRSEEKSSPFWSVLSLGPAWQ